MNKLVEQVKSILITILIVFAVRMLIVHAYRIPSGSMEDTILIGDFILSDRLTYGAPIEIPFTGIVLGKMPSIRMPERGEVVVFSSWENPADDFIKRCIGLPGDTVEMRNNVIFVNGKALPAFSNIKREQHHLVGFNQRIFDTANWDQKVVPPGCIFVMGDNVDNSADSRFYGFVTMENIKARAVVVYFSLDTSKSPLNISEFIRWNRIGRMIS